jgi:DNA-binding NtrC family response regulator
LETGEIQRVGADRILQTVDVRVIAATHRRLLNHVADKTFREDLYYRLNVVHIEVPPLRERREDIVVLLDHFLSTFATTHHVPVPEMDPEVVESMVDYGWPGNVRELRNVSERLVLRCRGERATPQLLPAEIRREAVARRPATAVVAERPPAPKKPQLLFDRMFKDGASFWSEVYEPFMARDLTRSDVREVVRLGLEHTRGNYKMLVGCFNMPVEDYKKFLSFLRKYQCHVPFQGFRMMAASPGRERTQIVTA